MALKQALDGPQARRGSESTRLSEQGRIREHDDRAGAHVQVFSRTACEWVTGAVTQNDDNLVLVEYDVGQDGYRKRLHVDSEHLRMSFKTAPSPSPLTFQPDMHFGPAAYARSKAAAAALQKVSLNPPTEEQARDLAHCMPPLGGQPIPAPAFLKEKWTEGQMFTAADDPDCVKEPWQAPKFIEDSNPLERSKATRVQKLSLPPKVDKNEDATSFSFACLVENVLTEKECRELLEQFNAKAFRPCLLNKSHGNQMLDPAVRDTFRVMVDSPNLAAWIFHVIEPHLPKQLEDGSSLVGLNPFLRCLCYTPGQKFESHMDNKLTIADGSFSRVSAFIYLNTVPKSYGGATTFCPVCTHWPCWHSDQDKVGASPACVKCQPLAGSVLLFSQDLRHEGSLLIDGLKYMIRTEAMYKKPSAQD